MPYSCELNFAAGITKLRGLAGRGVVSKVPGLRDLLFQKARKILAGRPMPEKVVLQKASMADGTFVED
jgi:hypothetical protein